jgi:hypothetical protein
LRTGDARWWELGEIGSRWWMDLGVSHCNRKGYSSTTGWGPGESYAIKHEVVDHCSRNIHRGHAHVSGLPALYLLTGERRALGVMHEVGTWWLNSIPTWFPFPIQSPHYSETSRDWAWPLFTLNEVYRGTGDVRYLQGSRDVVRHLVAWWKTPSDHLRDGVVVGRNDWTQGTGWWYSYPKIDNAPAGWNGVQPWMDGPLISQTITFYEMNKLANLTGVDPWEVEEMVLQTTNYITKWGYNTSRVNQPYDYWVYSEASYTSGANHEHIIYNLAWCIRLIVENPQRHNISRITEASRWGGVAQYWYNDYKQVYYRSTTSNGFYGYEFIFPADFFTIMKQLNGE